MAKARKVSLLSFTLPDKVGQLAAAAAHLAEAGVSIYALQAVPAGANAHFLLAVKNPAKARKALAPLAADFKEQAAICVEMPNKAGRLQKVAAKLAEAGVDVRGTWATAFTGKTASCVLLTSDDEKALALLKK